MAAHVVTVGGGGSPGAPSEDPVFTVLAVEAVPYAATPTVRFHLHVDDPAGHEAYAIALSTQIQIDPAKRVYDDETRARLIELFGAPDRWAATTHSFQWARIEALVPGFTGATSFAVEVPCSYDMEVAATRYFYSLPDGEVPLTFHFSGMVLYRGEADRLQVRPVPWACHATWRMPVSAWRGAVEAQYPGGTWIHLSGETLDVLLARKAARGDVSLDATVTALLAATESTRGAAQEATG